MQRILIQRLHGRLLPKELSALSRITTIVDPLTSLSRTSRNADSSACSLGLPLKLSLLYPVDMTFPFFIKTHPWWNLLWADFLACSHAILTDLARFFIHFQKSRNIPFNLSSFPPVVTVHAGHEHCHWFICTTCLHLVIRGFAGLASTTLERPIGDAIHQLLV